MVLVPGTHFAQWCSRESMSQLFLTKGKNCTNEIIIVCLLALSLSDIFLVLCKLNVQFKTFFFYFVNIQSTVHLNKQSLELSIIYSGLLF